LATLRPRYAFPYASLLLAMARVLIAGCGYVGSALAALRRDAGDQVTGLRRSASPLPEGVRSVRADVAQPATLCSLPPADAVVYAVSAAAREDAAYEQAYVTGLHNLIVALRPASPRLLFVSSTAVYAQQDGSWVDEGSATRPRHFSGRRLLQGEALARAAGVESCAVRLGGIYGPGRSALLERVRCGAAPVAPGPPRYTNRIHRDDAAGVLSFLLDLPKLPGCVLGVDCEPAPEAVVIGWLARCLGAPEPPALAPEPGSRRAGGNRRCSNRLLREAGFRFRYPSFREGYAALLETGG